MYVLLTVFVSLAKRYFRVVTLFKMYIVRKLPFVTCPLFYLFHGAKNKIIKISYSHTTLRKDIFMSGDTSYYLRGCARIARVHMSLLFAARPSMHLTAVVSTNVENAAILTAASILPPREQGSIKSACCS